VAGFVSIPVIATLHPAEVIDAPAMMSITFSAIFFIAVHSLRPDVILLHETETETRPEVAELVAVDRG